MNNKTKYSLLTYTFLLGTLFLVFVFSKDLYMQVNQNQQQVQLLEQQLKSKSQEYDALSKIKSEIDSGKVKDVSFNKFLSPYKEDELLDYFYTYANNHVSGVKIESLKLSDPKLNEFGFNEAQIELSTTFSSEQDLVDMMNFLLRSEKYNIYIHNFTYPYGYDFATPLKVNIPLKVLFK